MRDKIDMARSSAGQFVRMSNPEDEFSLISFSDTPELVVDFSDSIDDIPAKLAQTVPHGQTALIDAIYLGIRSMRQAKYRRRALLIISDGGDNHSRCTRREIESIVKEADVQIFAIGLYGHGLLADDDDNGQSLLKDISKITGGRAIAVNNEKELTQAVTYIGFALRSEYVLAYRVEKRAIDGKWHKVRVSLLPLDGRDVSRLHVYAKAGYYASHSK